MKTQVCDWSELCSQHNTDQSDAKESPLDHLKHLQAIEKTRVSFVVREREDLQQMSKALSEALKAPILANVMPVYGPWKLLNQSDTVCLKNLRHILLAYSYSTQTICKNTVEIKMAQQIEQAIHKRGDKPLTHRRCLGKSINKTGKLETTSLKLVVRTSYEKKSPLENGITFYTSMVLKMHKYAKL